MATKTEKNLWGLSRASLIGPQMGEKAGTRTAEVHVHMGKKAVLPKAWQSLFQNPDGSSGNLVRVSDSNEGVKILISPLAPLEVENDLRLKAQPPVRVRDAMGALVAQLERLEIEWAEVNFDMDSEHLKAAITGLEIALYRYKKVRNGDLSKFRLNIKHRGKTQIPKALEPLTILGQSLNVARHLVNLPPNELNPVTYAEFASALFAGIKNTQVEIWDEKRLKTEKANLLLAVGQGSSFPPRLVHIRYRPRGVKKAPIAFVGKGITFDTGGLDLKPAAGMRLMKKDMGGSASVLGLAYWAALSGSKQPADFYLAIAENAVSGTAFRPSDVLTARNGMSVEIHNTDAEGRLVLADALDIAVTNAQKPRVVIDVATLTGAIKVALGSALAGLFANDQKLGNGLQAAGLQVGDLSWPMPLLQKYRSQTNSTFADMVNAVDGFGGAVTAALFLEKFVGDVPWAHFDIYAWKDSAEGCWLECGGSGQSILGLANWLENQK